MAIKSTTNEFIEKAKRVHKNKYDYSKVNYINNRTKVCIICPEHGEFWQTPSSHLRGSACYFCGVNKSSLKQRYSKEEFIKKAKKIHGDKYNYLKVNYINYDTKVCIICPEHGEFWQTPNSHLKGKGCPSCYGNKKTTLEEFIKKAKEIHGNDYDYSESEYINTDVKLKIICSKHGEFWQTPYKHIVRKQGCPFCGGKLKLTANKFIEKAKLVHGNTYDYSKVEYINSQTKVRIICPIHGEFQQLPSKHLYKQGCPYCKKSKLEETVKEILDINAIKYTREQTFKWLKYNAPMRLDFYLPDYNIGIECQGEQHFMPVCFNGKNKKQGEENLKLNIKRDKLKKKLCEENNIKIIYINYNDTFEEIKNKINIIYD